MAPPWDVSARMAVTLPGRVNRANIVPNRRGMSRFSGLVQVWVTLACRSELLSNACFLHAGDGVPSQHHHTEEADMFAQLDFCPFMELVMGRRSWQDRTTLLRTWVDLRPMTLQQGGPHARYTRLRPARPLLLRAGLLPS